MKSQQFIRSFQDQIDKIFNPTESYTFLAGAGISMDPPSNLPSAKEIIRILIQKFTPKEEVERILGLEMLRYELIVQILQEIWDAELIFMDYFDTITEPNQNHLFLATAIIHQHFVLTTNFDYLIEQGLARIITNPEKYSQISPIISKSDFLKITEPYTLFAQNQYPLIKIHGSKTNIITQENTIESLVTTISDLGKDREAGETFAIEAYKKSLVNKILINRSLVVMGYSGSDDFDIGPLLREFPKLKQLIWIEHDPSQKEEIYTLYKAIPFDPYQPLVNFNEVAINSEEKIEDLKESFKKQSKTVQLLCEIRAKSNFPVFLIKGNTQYLLKKILWPNLFPDFSVIESRQEKDAEIAPKFQDWAEKQYIHKEIYDKYYFAARIYLDLNQFMDVIRTAENGLLIIENIELSTRKMMESNFYNLLGISYRDIGNRNKAMECYQKCVELEQEAKNNSGLASAYSGIGTFYLETQEFMKALEYFSKCLIIAQENNYRQKEATYLINLAMVYFHMGEYQKSFNFLQKSLTIAEEVGDLYSKAIIFSNMGKILKIEKKYELAIENYENALKINQELGQIRSVATRKSLIGTILYMQNKYENAESYYNQALASYKDLNDQDNLAKVRGNLALIHVQRQEYEQAISIYQDLLEFAEEQNDILGKSTRLTNLGYIYQIQNQFRKAIEIYQQAIALERKYNLLEGLATDLNNVGLCFYEMQNYDQSEPYFEEALTITNQIQHEELKHIILPNIRDLYEKKAEKFKDTQTYELAVQYFKKCLKIEHYLENQGNMAFYLNRIAITYYFDSKNEEAQDFFEKALKIAEELGDDHKKSDNYYYLGLVKEELNDYQSAIEKIRQSLKSAQKCNLISDYPILYKKIAQLYGKIGNPSLAVENYHNSYQAALDICDSTKNAKEISDNFINLAKEYYDLGKIEEGIRQLEIGLEIAQKFDFKAAVTEIALAVGYQWESRTNDYEKALKFYHIAGKNAFQYNQDLLWAQIERRIINLYKKEKKENNIIQILRKDLPILRKQNDNRKYLALNLFDLGKIYENQKKYPYAIQNYTEARDIFLQLNKEKEVQIISRKILHLKAKTNQD